MAALHFDSAPSSDEHVLALVQAAKQEDFGDGDVTASLLPGARKTASFRLVTRKRCVLAGEVVATLVLRAYDEAIHIEWMDGASDGKIVDAGVQPARGDPAQSARSCAAEVGFLATIRGPLGPILSAERVLLNFLQRLCGVATLTRRYVDAVAGTGARIYDTRKTTPGWRTLEKYAVRCGGGCNHRQGLYDAVLLKDNHLAGVSTGQLAGFVFDLLNRLDFSPPNPPLVEVEADSLEQAAELFKVVGVNVVLLDNFGMDDLRRAVELRDSLGLRDKVELEASGGITLDTVRAVADTGVERISVGAITHSAPAVDLSLERV